MGRRLAQTPQTARSTRTADDRRGPTTGVGTAVLGAMRRLRPRQRGPSVLLDSLLVSLAVATSMAIGDH